MTGEERGTSCTRFHCLQRVSLLRISPSLLSFSSSLFSVSLSLSLRAQLSIFSLAHFHPCHLAALLRVLFSSRCNFCHGPSHATTGSLQLDPRERLSLSLSLVIQGHKNKEKGKPKKNTNRPGIREEANKTLSRRKQGYWKKDVTGAMIFQDREIPRLLARARTFLRRRCAFCP